MVGHYFTVTLRGLRRHRAAFLLNVVGLATGLASALLIGLLVTSELRYDRDHPAADRSYRVAHVITLNGREIQVPMVPGPMAVRIESSLPVAERACRFVRRSMVVARDEHRFIEKDVLFVDPSFYDIFALPVISGRLADARTRPDVVVVTPAVARKYFGAASPVGEQLVIGGDTFTVAAEVEDIADRSHLGFALIAPLAALGGGDWIERWSANNFFTYVTLRPGGRGEDLQRWLDRLVEQELGPAFATSIGKTFPDFLAQGGRFGYFAQSLRSIHLTSRLNAELRPNGDLRTVLALAVVGLLILSIACATYINLTTARSTDRLQEIGVRLAVGAGRRDLASQFLLETALTVVFAGLLAVAVVAAILALTEWDGKGEVLGHLLATPRAAAAIAGGLVAVVGLAGLYPALVLSSLRPASMIGRGRTGGPGGNALRRALVVFQFAAATVLIAWTLIISRQIDFMRDKDLGYRPEGVVVLDGARELGERWAVFRDEAARLPGVAAASAASGGPARFVLEAFLYPGESTREEDLVLTTLIEADGGYAHTLGLRLIEGDPYTDEQAAARALILISRKVRERLGWPTAAGRLVTVGHVPATVAGVFEDIHLDPLLQPMRPAVIRPLGGAPAAIVLRLTPGAGAEALDAVGRVWSRFVPERPFSYASLEGELAAAYQGERRLAAAVRGFAIIAVVLSCLGIYGLAVHSASRRRREIGIRRAIGAGTGEITTMMVWDFFRWVVLAVLLAAPLALYAASRWLERFAHRAEVPPWLVPAAAAVVCLLALFAVASQALSAAVSNPAQCLREE